MARFDWKICFFRRLAAEVHKTIGLAEAGQCYLSLREAATFITGRALWKQSRDTSTEAFETLEYKTTW